MITSIQIVLPEIFLCSRVFSIIALDIISSFQEFQFIFIFCYFENCKQILLMIVSVLSNGNKMIKPLLNQTKKIVLWIHKLVLLNIQNFLLLDWMELPFFEQGLIFHDIWFYGSTFKIASMLNLRYTASKIQVNLVTVRRAFKWFVFLLAIHC